MGLVSRFREAGYTDIGLYYPADLSQLDAFEHFAREVAPGLSSTA